jgi:hypothetical protein
MGKCQEPGCNSVATEEWEGMQLCDDHYYLIRNKYKSEWDALLEK